MDESVRHARWDADHKVGRRTFWDGSDYYREPKNADPLAWAAHSLDLSACYHRHLLASIFHGKSRDTGVEKPKVPALQGKMGLSKSPTTLAERHLVDAE